MTIGSGVSIILTKTTESIARAVIKGGMTKNRVLILDMGATRTKIIVFAGYSVRFISSSLVCGSTFDSAISKKLNILTSWFAIFKIVKILAPDYLSSLKI